MWTRGKLLRLVDAPAIEAAIARAESRTSGEIQVSLAPFFWGSVRGAAERAFSRLGVGATRERNGVLLFVVPARRSFAVIGDEGIHARVGANFWAEIGELLRTHFRGDRYTEGLLAAIDALGEQLVRHFPADPAANPDEVANTVIVGDGR